MNCLKTALLLISCIILATSHAQGPANPSIGSTNSVAVVQGQLYIKDYIYLPQRGNLSAYTTSKVRGGIFVGINDSTNLPAVKPMYWNGIVWQELATTDQLPAGDSNDVNIYDNDGTIYDPLRSVYLVNSALFMGDSSQSNYFILAPANYEWWEGNNSKFLGLQHHSSIDTTFEEEIESEMIPVAQNIQTNLFISEEGLTYRIEDNKIYDFTEFTTANNSQSALDVTTGGWALFHTFYDQGSPYEVSIETNHNNFGTINLNTQYITTNAFSTTVNPGEVKRLAINGDDGSFVIDEISYILYGGNGITKSNDSLHLGGNLIQDTTLITMVNGEQKFIINGDLDGFFGSVKFENDNGGMQVVINSLGGYGNENDLITNPYKTLIRNQFRELVSGDVNAYATIVPESDSTLAYITLEAKNVTGNNLGYFRTGSDGLVMGYQENSTSGMHLAFSENEIDIGFRDGGDGDKYDPFTPAKGINIDNTGQVRLTEYGADSAPRVIVAEPGSGLLTPVDITGVSDGWVLTFGSGDVSWQPAGSSGEVNTASNLGGGLSNYDSKSGVDLRFNSFLASDFNLSSNLLSIDYTNGQASSGSVKGFLTSADWAIFNGKESALTFSTGLTRSTNTITNNLSIGISGGQAVIGGTGTTDDLILQPTSGVGTSGSDIYFRNGNNGATTVLTIFNNGNALLGNTGSTPTSTPTSYSFGGTYGTNTLGSSGNLKWRLYDDGTAANYYGIGMSAGYMDLHGGSGAGLFFSVNNGTEAMRILPNGNIGIGTSAPGFPLQISASTTGYAGYNVGIQIRGTNPGIEFLNTAGTDGYGFGFEPATGDMYINGISSSSPSVGIKASFTFNYFQSRFGLNKFGGSGVPTEAMDVDGNIKATGTITASNLGSSTYTPTASNTSNVAASTPYKAIWLRVGNSLYISGSIDIDATGAGAIALDLSLPPGITSNFGNSEDASGGISSDGSATSEGTTGIIQANATTDSIRIFIIPGISTNLHYTFWALIEII